MKDVTIRRSGKKKQGKAQAMKRGRLGRRASKMSGDDSYFSKN